MTRSTLGLTEVADKVRDGVVQFTKEEFEAALPVHNGTSVPLWAPLGIVAGEYTYVIPVIGTNKRIVIRSSVGSNGRSAPSGSDSIRLWVEYHYKHKWFALAKADSWTTRIVGWEDRMNSKMRDLWKLAVEDTSRRGNFAAVPALRILHNPPADVSEPPTLLSDSPPRQRSLLPESEPPPATIKYTREPNPEQRTAVEAPIDQAVRVLAPPGSGKTFILAHRYAHLLANDITPGEILAVTFNKKMATELLNRIAKVTPSVRGTLADRQVCTIHAACYRMLREVDLGKPNVASGYKIKRIIEELALLHWRNVDKRPGWTEIYAWVNMAKSQCLPNTGDSDFYRARLGESNGRALHEIRLKLDGALGDEGLWTYPDMLYLTESELKYNTDFREKFQRRFKWIMVDEGQDTNGQAMRILTTLAKPQNQFFMCADIDQLLYRFTGATPEVNVHQGFEDKFSGALTIKLVTNYRSTVKIIEAAQSLIDYNYGEHRRYNSIYHKEMQPRPDAPEGSPITYAFYPRPEDEAAALTDSLVSELVHREPDEIFVGARTRAQLGYLEGGLVRAKIPFINAAGGSFWTLKHVSEIVSYLKLAVDPSNDVAFARIYNVPSNYMTVPWRNAPNYGEYCPHRYLGRAFLQACKGSFKQIRAAMDYRSSFRPGGDDLIMLVKDIQQELRASTAEPQHILHVVREECYNKYLKVSEGITDNNAGGSSKSDDLDAVLDIAGQFATVKDFLSYVTDAEAASKASENKNWAGHVVISTVHRLKGLERNVVYGVGFSEGMDGMSGLLPHTFSMVAPPHTGTLPMGGKGLIEDERCVAYVLCTRAREEVHLSGIEKYRGRGMEPSRFIGEMNCQG